MTSAASTDGGGAASTATTQAPGTTGPATGDSTTGAAPVEPGPDASVVAFEDAHVFFLGWDEGQNARSLDVTLDFPEAGLGYTSATLELALGCPEGACDWWDRAGYIGVVEDAGTETERVIEVARFITPYRVEGAWSLDVSPLRPLLSGSRTIRVHIDTWVGPGHANGNGWLVDARFDFVGGVPNPMPVEVIPLWPYSEATIGDPASPVGTQLAPADVELPTGAARVELYSLITGHGQGNLDNCAEFCQLAHGYLVGDAAVQRTVWRDDCADNPVDNQQGTWTLARAGWCPGADVLPWVADVTDALTPDGSLSVAYDLSSYENTCRPDAPVCMGCALGTGCEYDSGNHTPPVIKMSASLVVYEATR
ncbi:MAG: hypothetical protein K0V04_39020 [Deltaproteobacteria bacterium]|nr:hypothetical protein [Deltaproteobacteria bacterium]